MQEINESKILSRTSVALARNERIIPDSNNRNIVPPTPYAYDRGEEQGSHLLDYWRIIRKHVWLIIGISLLIPTLVAVYLIRKPDIYEAQARIQVDLENSNPLLGGMS